MQDTDLNTRLVLVKIASMLAIVVDEEVAKTVTSFLLV